MHPQVLLLLILKAKESFKNTNKEAVEKNKQHYQKVKVFALIYTISGHLGICVFLFLLQYTHSSLTEVVLPLPPVSIFYTVRLYVEVTPVIDMNWQ